jgi:catechol 2,3-dioxygenase-like lactoylglutathione lyase family enzyme
MEINGIAHIQLTVNDLSRCMGFYEKLLSHLGLTVVVRSQKGLYCIGGKTAIAITRSSDAHRNTPFDQRRIGLHHICFRARSREDVDEVFEFLPEIGAKVIHPPEEGPWFPGYYSLLFEDPDGIRLEVNHVPGEGYLGAEIESEVMQGVTLPLDGFPGFDDYPNA